METIQVGGKTYTQDAAGRWKGPDGKTYVSRGPKDNRTMMAVSTPESIEISGSSGGRGETKVREDGLIQKGTVTGMKPMNIPDIAVNPFQLAGFAEGGLQTSYEQGLPGSGDVEVGAKNTENTPTPEQIGENGQQIAPDSADPQLNGANPSAEVPIDWMNRQPSLEEGRRRAFLDAPRGSGPMVIRERMNAAMGMEDEIDDNKRMTGRTFINNAEGQATLFDDSADGSKMARNNYLDDPQKFLAGVMSGDVVLGGQNGDQLEEQSGLTLEATETPSDITGGNDAAPATPPVDLTSLEIPADVIERAKQTEYVPGIPLDDQNPEYAAARDRYLSAYYSQ